MESIEKKTAIYEDGTRYFLCGLEYCDDLHYAKGFCAAHYQQMRTTGEVKPKASQLSFPPCAGPECRNRAITKRGNPLCQGHINQLAPTHPGYVGYLRPLKYYMNEGMTENGRVCRDCYKEKPLTEFYDRNQWKVGRSKASKSVRCKECYKHDMRYYQGREDTRADGSDPLDYANNPDEQQRRLEKRKTRA
jgi:hypothetical protein